MVSFDTSGIVNTVNGPGMMFAYCTVSFSWTTSMGNASRSSNPSTKSRIWLPFNPLRAGTCLHSECLRSLTAAAGGRLLKLDQTLVRESGGTVETRILIDIGGLIES